MPSWNCKTRALKTKRGCDSHVDETIPVVSVIYGLR
jgi:hypothetical protein